MYMYVSFLRLNVDSSSERCSTLFR